MAVHRNSHAQSLAHTVTAAPCMCAGMVTYHPVLLPWLDNNKTHSHSRPLRTPDPLQGPQEHAVLQRQHAFCSAPCHT
jgi:hypothetical protein